MKITKLKKGQPYSLWELDRVLECDGQLYHVIRRRWHVTKAGRELRVLDFKSNCAECGALFEASLAEEGDAAYFVRRCPAHRRKGSPVRKKIRTKK